jgi:hypothetical protein
MIERLNMRVFFVMRFHFMGLHTAHALIPPIECDDGYMMDLGQDHTGVLERDDTSLSLGLTVENCHDI